MPDYLWHNTTLGIRRALSSRSGFTILEVAGFSLPDKDHIYARAPQQHGATYVDTFYRPRECSLIIMVKGRNAEDFQAKHRLLVRALNPLDDGYLQIDAEGGQRYTLTCRPVSAVALNRLNAIAGEALVQFVADDPYFHMPEQGVNFTSIYSEGLTIPFTIPAIISSSSAAAQETVINGGQVPCYPIITLTAIGTVTSPQFANITTGKTLSIAITLNPGQTLVINMGERTATKGNENVLGSVSGSFWSLAVGDNDIRITHDGGGAFTAIVSFVQNFLAVI